MLPPNTCCNPCVSDRPRRKHYRRTAASVRALERRVGLDVGRKGLKDEEIVVLLRRLRQPTFFTRDLGFYAPELRHRHYAIVVAAVGQYELAGFVRRLLHHPEFDTHANRAGKVMRIASSGIACWQLRRQQEAFVAWEARS